MLKSLIIKGLTVPHRCENSYSQVKFGISVQKKISESLGESGNYDQQKWNAFESKVAWRVNNKWLYSKDQGV